MTTDELNAIVQAVMLEMEKAGVDFDFKAETPQPTDLVYVMRGTSDKYQGITVKWQNLLDIIVQKATEAKDEAVSAKDIALQTLATIQGIENNVSSMKSSVETTANDVSTMKASVETSEANVTQMKASVEATKSDVEGMKTSVEATKTEVEGLLDTKADATYVDGELAKKVNYSDSLTYEEITANNIDLTNKVASAEALKHLKPITIRKTHRNYPSPSYVEQTDCRITIPANSIYGIYVEREYYHNKPKAILITTNPPTMESYDKYPIAYGVNDGSLYRIMANAVGFVSEDTNIYIYAKDEGSVTSGTNPTNLSAWYITF